MEIKNIISTGFVKIKEGFKQLSPTIKIALAAIGSLGVLYRCYLYYTERNQLFAAKNFLLKEQYSNALQVFNHLLGRNPSHTQAKLGQARCLYKLNQIDQAELAYRAVRERYPQNVEALMGLTKISEKKNEVFPRLWREVQHACEATGLIPSLFYAKALRKLGETERALEQCFQFNNAPGLMAQAKILKNRNLDQAVDLCRQACELEPQNAKALRSYAYYLRMQGQNQEAIDYYKRSLEINPLHSKSHLGLIELYILERSYERAEEACEAYINHIPQENTPAFREKFSDLICDLIFDYLQLDVNANEEKIKTWSREASHLYNHSPCSDFRKVIRNCDDLIILNRRENINLLADCRELSVRKVNEAQNDEERRAWEALNVID